jgi:SHS family lactate transporter-like MFS transporter
MAPYFLKNLVPRRETRAHARPLLTAVATITWVQWAMFFSGYVKFSLENYPLLTDFRLLAWTCDALDFFSVSLSVTSLETQFGQSSSSIVIGSFFSQDTVPCSL